MSRDLTSDLRFVTSQKRKEENLLMTRLQMMEREIPSNHQLQLDYKTPEIVSKSIAGKFSRRSVSRFLPRTVFFRVNINFIKKPLQRTLSV